LLKETEMGHARPPAETLHLGSRCYRLTASGRACVDIVESGQQTLGSLSRYLHDVLMLCGSGMWFDQLRQFMPPRSLEESLQSLLLLGLIEMVEPEGAMGDAPAAPLRRRPVTGFGTLAAA
jgi:hypothetical protein